VVLKPESIRARLLKLEEVVSRLQELQDLDPEQLRHSFRDTWAMERGLQLGAEILFDVGNHILSAHFGSSADSYGAILTRLADRGVLDASLRDRLQGLGGFRNILVHGYATLDPERVLKVLASATAVFTDFARAIGRWCDSLPS